MHRTVNLRVSPLTNRAKLRSDLFGICGCLVFIFLLSFLFVIHCFLWATSVDVNAAKKHTEMIVLHKNLARHSFNKQSHRCFIRVKDSYQPWVDSVQRLKPLQAIQSSLMEPILVKGTSLLVQIMAPCCASTCI